MEKRKYKLGGKKTERRKNTDLRRKKIGKTRKNTKYHGKIGIQGRKKTKKHWGKKGSKTAQKEKKHRHSEEKTEEQKKKQ